MSRFAWIVRFSSLAAAPSAAATAILFALATSPTSAQGAAWCLYENNSRGAVTCSFHTFEQCLETRSGVGGSCGANPYPSYRAPYSADGSTERRKRRR